MGEGKAQPQALTPMQEGIQTQGTKEITPEDYKLAQGKDRKAKGWSNGICEYFMPLGKNASQRILPEGVVPRSTLARYLLVTVQLLWALPGRIYQQATQLKSQCRNFQLQVHLPVKKSKSIKFEQAMQPTLPQKWEVPLSPTIVIKGRGMTLEELTTKGQYMEGSSEGSLDSMAFESPKPRKKSNSLCWETSLTQEELE
ncbi:hypothetical protein NDU88_002600 [Pleurodeles waltl]|uniref:Uncharacterized protein n=1 Tax=Pleurodeles waltl TaxID=8319 RepID=A0AAV7T2V9_PLEWA|nr:hypothetical protein NDU88_002600 [Pleurodeles waltl]